MSDLWLGLLLSIPVGLLVNLLSRPVLRIIDQRSTEASARRAARDQEYVERARALMRDQAALYTFYLRVLVRAAYMGALFGIMSGFFFLIGQGSYVLPFGEADVVGGAAYFAGQFLALLGGLVVLNIARAGLDMMNQVRELSAANGPAPTA